MTDWISVEDRFPEKWDDYLVSYFYYKPKVTIAEFNPHRHKKGMVPWTKCLRLLKRVTHWMPLPKGADEPEHCNCGGEMVDKRLGDEYYKVCLDCGKGGQE